MHCHSNTGMKLKNNFTTHGNISKHFGYVRAFLFYSIISKLSFWESEVGYIRSYTSLYKVNTNIGIYIVISSCINLKSVVQ